MTWVSWACVLVLGVGFPALLAGHLLAALRRPPQSTTAEDCPLSPTTERRLREYQQQ